MTTSKRFLLRFAFTVLFLMLGFAVMQTYAAEVPRTSIGASLSATDFDEVYNIADHSKSQHGISLGRGTKGGFTTRFDYTQGDLWTFSGVNTNHKNARLSLEYDFLSTRLRPYGVISATHISTKTNGSTVDYTGLASGLGLKLDVTDNITFSADVRNVEFDSPNYDSTQYNAGLTYSFGGGSKVTQHPVHAPKVPAVAHYPTEEGDTIGIALYFHNDVATLNTAQKLQLTRVLEETNNLLVIGHASKVGSARYNLELSSLRAKNVRDFIESLNLDVDVVIRAEGESKATDNDALSRKVEVYFK